MSVNAAVKAELEALFTSQVNADFINSASEESAFMRMARRLPNMSSRQTRLPVMSALPIVYWVNGDAGQKQTTKAAWDNVYINAEEIAVIVPISENLSSDIGYDYFGLIKPKIIDSIGKAVDQAVFFGIGHPVGWLYLLLQKSP